MRWLDGITDFNGHEFEQAALLKLHWFGDGQGSLTCCSPWGHKELDMTEQLNWTEAFVRSLENGTLGSSSAIHTQTAVHTQTSICKPHIHSLSTNNYCLEYIFLFFFLLFFFFFFSGDSLINQFKMMYVLGWPPSTQTSFSPVPLSYHSIYPWSLWDLSLDHKDFTILEQKERNYQLHTFPLWSHSQ